MTHPLFTWRRSAALLTLLCVAGVALADWLFYEHPVGCSVAIFSLALFVLLCVRDGAGGMARRLPGRILTLALVGLLFALADEPDLLRVMMTLAALVALAMISRAGWTNRVSDWIERIAWLVFIGPVQIIRDNGIAKRWVRRHPNGHRVAIALDMVRWIVPLALGGVFVAIFAIANPIISQWISDSAQWLYDFLTSFFDRFPLARIAFWVATAVAIRALLRWRGRRAKRTADATVATSEPMSSSILRPALITRCLLVFNAIFLVQSILDMIYLLGGATLPRGMTYAEYAQRGAYPLVAAALLAAAFVLVAFRRGSETERSPVMRRLVYLWIAQNIFLMVGAVWRLALYVSVYTLTRWRIAAAVWMLIVALGLIWIICRLIARRDNAWLLRVNIVTTIVVLYACSFVNFDGVIANFNVRHCREAGGPAAPIDLNYLQSLGPESIPAIAWVFDKLPSTQQVTAKLYTSSLHERLIDQNQDWRGWTLRRSRLLHATLPQVP